MSDPLQLFTSPSAFPNPQRLWKRWQQRAYSDGGSGLAELDYLKAG